MNTRYDTLENKNVLIFSFIAVVIIYLIGNIINQEQFPITEDIFMTDVLFIVTPVMVIGLGAILVLRYGIKGNHSIAWILFTLAFASWFAGEMTYSYDQEYDFEDISTFTSEFFFIAGYPLFLAFTIFYLKPRKKIITKNIILLSSLVGLLLVIPTLYLTFDVGDEVLSDIEIFLFAMYPILDSIILVPAIIAAILFFRGQVNLLWTMVMFGTIFLVLADTSYLVFLVEENYYPGHPLDILYIWSYILYALGAYSHIKLYKKSESNFS